MNYLFEIYTEEIPATLLNSAVKNLKSLAEKRLSEFSIKFSEVKTFGTPKRLVLFIENLDEKEENKKVEIKGPSYSVAFDKEGNPTKVFEKFVQSNNLSTSDISVRETKKGKYLFATKLVKGKGAEEIVRDVSLFVLENLRFPKSMHWEESGVRFVRPIRGMLALLDDKLIEFSFAGVETGRITYGLRIDKPKEIEIKDPRDYFTKMRENYVILPFDERRKITERKAKSEASKVNGKPLYTFSHLSEIVNLTEYPTPFLASIDREAFNIPECITASIIEGHMKSLKVVDEKGNLLPYFIGVRNGSSDFIDVVRKGYEKVVKARVLDGKFFFEEDKKVKLDSLVDKLSGVVFLKGLGSMKDKTDRLVRIASEVSDALGVSNESKKDFERAAFLSKADLLTNVVREFPELQGTMGGIYAKIQGEREAVSSAISEQYLPAFAGDKLPQTELGKYLSIIDKTDTICGAFSVGVKVSGSKDPFGLRRAGSGIMQIVMSEKKTSFPLTFIIEKALATLVSDKEKIEQQKKEVLDFLKERVRAILKEKGFESDIVNAVCSLSIDFAPSYTERASVIKKHLEEETLLLIVLSNKRVKNILAKANTSYGNVKPDLFFERDEENLYNAITESKSSIKENLEKGNYEKVMEIFYVLHPVIAQFFDTVLVMDKDEKVRENRLALLGELKNLFDSFADFSALSVKKK